MENAHEHRSVETRGAVIKWAGRYDALIWLLTLGRERGFRERLLRMARLRPGESVLDVGCGTGGLAIEVKRQVGASGSVTGVDPSAAMIARAEQKARKAGTDVAFRTAAAEALPFSDATFDVVVTTLVLHHLPGETRRAGVAEMRRVLKPGGRLYAVDFGRSSAEKKGLLGRIHGHGGVSADRLIALATDAGLEVIDSGPAGKWDLQFVLARKP
jgi:ubiquinone/menaquinone biosynthesis C-methylase UbiE